MLLVPSEAYPSQVSAPYNKYDDLEVAPSEFMTITTLYNESAFKSSFLREFRFLSIYFTTDHHIVYGI